MLANRLIPTLLLKDGRLVKTVQFDKIRDVGNPVTAAKIYDAQGVDELLFLDITASRQKRDIAINIISHIAEECFMPLTAGGGIRDCDDIRKLLMNGVDKVSINTTAVRDPDFISEAAKKFGSQCIVVGIDFKVTPDGSYKVYIDGGRTRTDLDPLAWAKEVQQRGAGEIFLYSIDKDGTMSGYELNLIRTIADAIEIPLIACGGAGKLEDFVEVIKTGHASAAAAASIFHFTDQSPIKVRSSMRQAGLNVRDIYDS